MQVATQREGKSLRNGGMGKLKGWQGIFHVIVDRGRREGACPIFPRAGGSHGQGFSVLAWPFLVRKPLSLRRPNAFVGVNEETPVPTAPHLICWSKWPPS